MVEIAEKTVDPSSLANRQSERPLAAVAIAFALGIAFSLTCRAYIFAGIAISNAILILSAYLALRQNRLLCSFALGLSAISVSGFLVAIACRDGFPARDVRNHISGQRLRVGEPVSTEGCVIKESEMRGDESIFTLELKAFLHKDHWIVSKGKAIVRIAANSAEDSRPDSFKLMRGDRVRMWATWNVPRNFENPGSADSAGQLERRGIYLVGKVKSTRLLETIPGGCIDPWTQVANRVGTRVRRSLDPLRARGQDQRAAILASLIIGDYSGLTANTRQIFQNSGTFHVLVISGLHVAWMAGLLLQFLKLAWVPERIRYLAAFLVIFLYTLVVGFQASISRCLWMFLLYLVGRMIFRQADAVNVLLASAVILLLFQPSWLFEVGFQLSFLSVLAIAMTAVPFINRYLIPILRPSLCCGKTDRIFLDPGRWHRIGRRLRAECELIIEAAGDRMSPVYSSLLGFCCRGFFNSLLTFGSIMATSLAVQIWLQPLLAFYFNRLSWVAPLANVLIVPLSSFVLGAGAAAACTATLPWIGPMLIRLSGWLASSLLLCAAWIADIPGAWQRCPTPTIPWILSGIILLFFWCFFEWRKFWLACAGIALFLACLSRGSAPVFGSFLEKRFWGSGNSGVPWNKGSSILSLTFLDVGEGDSIVIRFPDRRVWLLDAGGLRQTQAHEESAYIFDIGEAVVSRYLWHFWINRIDQAIISHPDTDHSGGMATVFRNFAVGNFGYAQTGPDRVIADLKEVARKEKIREHQFQDGFIDNMGPVKIQVLNPPGNSQLSTTNENSLVLRISFRQFAAILPGDLEKGGETAFLSQTSPLSCQLLKVAHHGSRSGTSDSLLDRTGPRWAVLSVGRNNPFGHPSKETVQRLLRHRARPLSTMDEGAITFVTDGASYVLRSYRNGILETGEL